MDFKKAIVDVQSGNVKYDVGGFFSGSVANNSSALDLNVQLGFEGKIISIVLKAGFMLQLSDVLLDYITCNGDFTICGLVKSKTQELPSIKLGVVTFPTTLTAAGNLRVSVEESSIKQPVDIQDHWAESVVLLPSGARTAGGNSTDTDVGRFLYGVICIDVTAVSGTTPSLDVYVKAKNQYSGKYKTIFQQLGINAVATYFSDVLTIPQKYVRVEWTITGTSPSFTFSVSGEFKS